LTLKVMEKKLNKKEIGNLFTGLKPEKLDKLIKQCTCTGISMNEMRAISKLNKEYKNRFIRKIISSTYSNFKNTKNEVRIELKERIPRNMAPMNKRFKLFSGDIENVYKKIKRDSVDFIITDPPYPEKYLPLYDTLGKISDYCLKEGGSLLCMTGQSYLPNVMRRLDKHLTYNWTLSYYTPGGKAVQVWPRKVLVFWKPVLWFTKGKYKKDWVGDVVKSATNENDKRFHCWGQTMSGMEEIFQRFVYPGDLILDPFLGGGTTGIVALKKNCSFIGVDIDKECIVKSRMRIKNAIKKWESEK
tara:strand:+ start:497 stop:1399 length:903 start_codon:yes stop_codon:yes gene_type:complete